MGKGGGWWSSWCPFRSLFGGGSSSADAPYTRLASGESRSDHPIIKGEMKYTKKMLQEHYKLMGIRIIATESKILQKQGLARNAYIKGDQVWRFILSFLFLLTVSFLTCHWVGCTHMLFFSFQIVSRGFIKEMLVHKNHKARLVQYRTNLHQLMQSASDVVDGVQYIQCLEKASNALHPLLRYMEDRAEGAMDNAQDAVQRSVDLDALLTATIQPSEDSDDEELVRQQIEQQFQEFAASTIHMKNDAVMTQFPTAPTRPIMHSHYPPTTAHHDTANDENSSNSNNNNNITATATGNTRSSAVTKHKRKQKVIINPV